MTLEKQKFIYDAILVNLTEFPHSPECEKEGRKMLAKIKFIESKIDFLRHFFGV